MKYYIKYRIKDGENPLVGEKNLTPFMKHTLEYPFILPTGGAARTYSALTTETFQKISMLNEKVTGECLEKLYPTFKTMAKAEGLLMHLESVEHRLRHYRRMKRNK
jgi:histidinol dehydrogenase